MTNKQRKEIEEIVTRVTAEFLINREVCQAENKVDSLTKVNQVIKADKVARDEMFKNLTTGLPTVYNENNPILVRRYSDWLSLITRAHFNNEPLFDEMSLTEIKNYFEIQLGFYYNNEVERVLKLHSQVIKDYYAKKERGTK